jgi:hypothetical protein
MEFAAMTASFIVRANRRSRWVEEGDFLACPLAANDSVGIISEFGTASHPLVADRGQVGLIDEGRRGSWKAGCTAIAPIPSPDLHRCRSLQRLPTESLLVEHVGKFLKPRQSNLDTDVLFTNAQISGEAKFLALGGRETGSGSFNVRGLCIQTPVRKTPAVPAIRIGE